MAGIVVCGGGVVGLSAAMMLAGDGHAVTVLEPDPDGPPQAAATAWGSWKRRGVVQFHQPHGLFSRFRQVCEAELPGLCERLVAAGCVRLNRIDAAPPGLREPRPGDERFEIVTGRRPVVEAVFAEAAAEQVDVRRGVAVTGLLTGPSDLAGVPHVTGVVTSDGERIPADLVVDATGRRGPTERWLAAIGAAPPHVEGQDARFLYYTRFLRGSPPALRGPALAPLGSITVLTLAADNDTWSVTVFGASSDTALKALRHREVFDRVVAACPLQAHWLDGEALNGVSVMAGAIDRYRRFVVDGRPVATGYAAVGDAWACTNPSAGRGLTVGIVHAQALRAVVREHLGDPAAFAIAWDERTERVVTPFYRTQLAADRVRIAEMGALRRGETPPRPDPLQARFGAAVGQDPEAFRGMLDMLMCLAQPQEVFARPAVQAAIAAAGDPMPLPAPDRDRLVTLLAA
jgi:2-polyprenyl-6-methoxyphenol hydroxylase-like FAD-dependent oxidoreductase